MAGTAGVGGIKDWHAHVYFDAGTKEAALAIRDAVAAGFPDAAIGRVHERPVGPHPEWSFQVAFAPALFGTIVPWLALNRRGLDVLVHPNIDDAVRDHTDHAMWLGHDHPLDVERLK